MTDEEVEKEHKETIYVRTVSGVVVTMRVLSSVAVIVRTVKVVRGFGLKDVSDAQVKEVSLRRQSGEITLLKIMSSFRYYFATISLSYRFIERLLFHRFSDVTTLFIVADFINDDL